MIEVSLYTALDIADKCEFDGNRVLFDAKPEEVHGSFKTLRKEVLILQSRLRRQANLMSLAFGGDDVEEDEVGDNAHRLEYLERQANRRRIRDEEDNAL